jgi:hypothetical protein
MLILHPIIVGLTTERKWDKLHMRKFNVVREEIHFTVK